ncbi:2OG-Fe(II) oxygenase [Ekhidna sp.]|uniref:2OG-Fe(II) oxygenase n=1 Tax=Ekhidna sp. TaxID=2608089 RepID=UPI003B5AD4D9
MHTLPLEKIGKSLNEHGFASLPALIDPKTCEELISLYPEEGIFRKTVVMERHRFGLGEYKYFNYPLPAFIEELRANMYSHLAPIANQWMRTLGIDTQYPEDHETFLTTCHSQGQQKPTPLILKYGKGGYNTLHQDLYGSVYFPIQLVLFLSDYGSDYKGGEFVITEQVPRSQSKALVIKPQKGDALLLATSFRPVKGSRGYYRANLRHGVSEVTSGIRYTMGIIFHDATS